jgi:hypothetical protein
MRNNKDLRVGKWREHLAQDPDPALAPAPEESSEADLVHDFDSSPIADWEKYLQLIVRALSARYNDADLELVGSHIDEALGDSSTFEIKGGLRFKSRPLKLLKEYGQRPLFFSALIADGQLVEPIGISAG